MVNLGSLIPVLGLVVAVFVHAAGASGSYCYDDYDCDYCCLDYECQDSSCAWLWFLWVLLIIVLPCCGCISVVVVISLIVYCCVRAKGNSGGGAVIVAPPATQTTVGVYAPNEVPHPAAAPPCLVQEPQHSGAPPSYEPK
ncbi:uncharacterized protein LOC142358201 [Convolutriloba macropyga]|uniref:uncharacterized protein LOC142358201 n=1 Tax=Convolutriloba macropyga TaxID=536237 RepID=UPI003F525306